MQSNPFEQKCSVAWTAKAIGQAAPRVLANAAQLPPHRPGERADQNAPQASTTAIDRCGGGKHLASHQV